MTQSNTDGQQSADCREAQNQKYNTIVTKMM